MRPSTGSRLLVAAALLAAGSAACADSDVDRADPSRSPVVVLTLPPGELASLVVQPDEVPSGVVPLLTQTGPADIAEISAFSADPVAAERSLREHGFQSAYVATYADQETQRSVSNVVARFSSAAGATADLTADLDAARSGGTSFDVSDLGDQAGGVRTARHATTGQGELVTIRWRRGETTWLLAVGAPGEVDSDAVVALARKVLARAG